MPDLEIDLFVGSPDEEQPDWRDDDEDDGIADDDDPEPIAPEILTELLGFDPSEETD
jgi:hypothetical protein